MSFQLLSQTFDRFSCVKCTPAPVWFYTSLCPLHSCDFLKSYLYVVYTATQFCRVYWWECWLLNSMTRRPHIPIPSANEDFLLLRLRGFSEMAHNWLNKCLVYNFVIPTVANFFRKYNFHEYFIFEVGILLDGSSGLWWSIGHFNTGVIFSCVGNSQ